MLIISTVASNTATTLKDIERGDIVMIHLHVQAEAEAEFDNVRAVLLTVHPTALPLATRFYHSVSFVVVHDILVSPSKRSVCLETHVSRKSLQQLLQQIIVKSIFTPLCGLIKLVREESTKPRIP